MKNKIILLLTKNISIILGIFILANYNVLIEASNIFNLFTQKVSEYNTIKEIIADYIFHIFVIIIIASIIIKTIIQIKEIKENTKQ